MKLSKFNREGYRDPTAYDALEGMDEGRHRRRSSKPRQERQPYRPIVYVCSPFSGDVQTNIENARKYSRFAVDRGTLPITPHLLYPQFLNDDDPKERELGTFFGLVLLPKCREVWVFGTRISAGMSREIRKARMIGIPIRYFDEACQEVTVGD